MTTPAELTALTAVESLHAGRRDEEWANSLTHFIGLVLSLIGVGWLMPLAVHTADLGMIIAAGIYGTTLVAVYAASFFSHYFQEPRKKHLFRVLDQASIYLLIAGTFTPIAFAYLQHGNWWIVFVVEWVLAVAGCWSKLFVRHRIDSVATSLYLLLGWLPVTAWQPVMEQMPQTGLRLIAIGGLFYTVGTVFLMNDHRVRYLHCVWHILVIIASICHFLAIAWYVVPGVAY